MALGTTFATLPQGNVAASTLDTNFNQVGAMGVTACTATGTNTIALAPNANQPNVSAYANYQLFSFVAPNTSTGSVQVNVSGLGAIPLYISNGSTQAGSGNISAGVYYEIVYNSALNSGGGGAQIVSPSTIAASVTTQPIVGRFVNLDFHQMTVTTATFSCSEVIVETALGGTTTKLASLSGLTLNIATTGIGGMDTGSAPTSLPLYIYLMYNPSTLASGLIGTTQGAGSPTYTGANAPSGYTQSAYISTVMTNGSAQMAGFYQLNGTVYFPQITLLTSGTATSVTAVNVPALIPAQARYIGGNIGLNAINMSLTLYGSTSGIGEVGFNIANSPSELAFANLPIITTSTFFYLVSGSSANVRMSSYTLF